jgi:hypothetical protein
LAATRTMQHFGTLREMRGILNDYPAGTALSPEGRGRVAPVISEMIAMVAEIKNIGIVQIGEMPEVLRALSDPNNPVQVTTGQAMSALNGWALSLTRALEALAARGGVVPEDLQNFLRSVRNGTLGQ